MYHLMQNMLRSKAGLFLLSFIIGFGMASLLRVDCTDGDCVDFVPPNPKEIDQKLYKFGDTCYEFNPSPQACVSTANIIARH